MRRRFTKEIAMRLTWLFVLLSAVMLAAIAGGPMRDAYRSVQNLQAVLGKAARK